MLDHPTPKLHYPSASTFAHVGMQWLLGAAVFLLFVIIAIVSKRLILKFTKHAANHQAFSKLFAQTVQATVLIVGLLSALGTAGIDITAMVTSLGLAGFALGYALKDYLSNILAGYMILFYRPFKLGDTVSVGASQGEVTDVNLRYTTLKSDGQVTLIPNASLLSNSVNIHSN